MRPAMVLLMSQAVNAHMAAVSVSDADIAAVGVSSYTTDGLPRHLSRTATPTKQPDTVATHASTSSSNASASLNSQGGATWLPPAAIWPLQHRLAEIVEMIHTASLLHDDVIDTAETRRGLSSVNSVFGNKLAVLAGDFLLARASVCLARLRNIPVVELMSTVIEHLVKGEVMQMKTALAADAAGVAAFHMYMRKT